MVRILTPKTMMTRRWHSPGKPCNASLTDRARMKTPPWCQVRSFTLACLKPSPRPFQAKLRKSSEALAQSTSAGFCCSSSGVSACSEANPRNLELTRMAQKMALSMRCGRFRIWLTSRCRARGRQSQTYQKSNSSSKTIHRRSFSLQVFTHSKSRQACQLRRLKRFRTSTRLWAALKSSNIWTTPMNTQSIIRMSQASKLSGWMTSQTSLRQASCKAFISEGQRHPHQDLCRSIECRNKIVGLLGLDRWCKQSLDHQCSPRIKISCG